MTTKPQVLIFDDNEIWASNYELAISRHYLARSVITVDEWHEFISAPYWSAIVVDVQILGQKKSGLDFAKEAILKHGITTPVIIISGIAPLEDIKEKYNQFFFDFIPHENYSARLLSTINRACDEQIRHEHVVRMLTVFTEQRDLLDYKLSSTDIEEVTDEHKFTEVKQIFGSMEGQTLHEIIKNQIPRKIDYQNHVGKLLFHIIRKEYN